MLNHTSSLVSLSLLPSAVVAALALAIASLSVYYVLMEPGQAAAASNATASGTYYYTLDHIGRPFNLRDSTRTLRWYEHHYAFGDSIEEETVNGQMYAGAGYYAITWKPDFRFPGQYEEVDMYPFVQNHYREYMPEYGSYSRRDPMYDTLLIKSSSFSYVHNPLSLFDFWGLADSGYLGNNNYNSFYGISVPVGSPPDWLPPTAEEQQPYCYRIPFESCVFNCITAINTLPLDTIILCGSVAGLINPTVGGVSTGSAVIEFYAKAIYCTGHCNEPWNRYPKDKCGHCHE